MDHPSNAPASPRLQWFGQTDRGHVRKNNEDTFLALEFDAREIQYLGKIGEAPTENIDFVFAVSDGMGGARSGEFASRITVDRITRLFPRIFRLSPIWPKYIQPGVNQQRLKVACIPLTSSSLAPRKVSAR